MKFTYFGHGCYGLNTNGIDILVDPFISENPLAGHIAIDKIPADFIFLTHAHGDHIADVQMIATRTGATLISNYEIITYFEGMGLKGHPMNIGGQFTFPFGTLKAVNAIHSSTFPNGSNGGNPLGFVLWNDEVSIYLAGDTALTLDMQLLPRMCPPLNAAVLPIGDNFTMGVSDAVIAAEFIQCDRIIGVHYNTFGYIIIDKHHAVSAFSAVGKTLLLPDIGQSIQL